jgi:hypothetical protein
MPSFVSVNMKRFLTSLSMERMPDYEVTLHAVRLRGHDITLFEQIYILSNRILHAHLGIKHKHQDHP